MLTTLPARGEVPNALFPADNEWDVPVLDLALQAEFAEIPILKWGRDRKIANSGTYHFYTTDPKFLHLVTDPTGLLRSGCVAVVEPNFSCGSQTPRSLALTATYEKRWLARYWQSYGLRVWVDLSVDPRHSDLNLLGVPHGWMSYATRAYADELHLVEEEARLAQDHAGYGTIRFLVYGGGKAAQALCYQRGWIWIADDMKSDWSGPRGQAEQQ